MRNVLNVSDCTRSGPIVSPCKIILVCPFLTKINDFGFIRNFNDELLGITLTKKFISRIVWGFLNMLVLNLGWDIELVTWILIITFIMQLMSACQVYHLSFE